MSFPDLLPVVVGMGITGMFAASAFEKIVPIIPSYLMLLLFGSASMTAHELVLTIVATSAGSVIGTACVYGLGRALGESRVRRGVEKYGKYVFCPPERYQRMAVAYRRNHFWVSLCGQMIPVARLYLSVPAGVLRLRAGRFLTASAIGIAAYNSIFLTTGFILRKETHDPVTIGVLLSAGLIAAELVTAGTVKWIFYRKQATLS